MGLLIKSKEKEEYYLFVSGDLKLGDYIRINKKEIRNDGYGTFSRDHIEAPSGLTILRKEIVDEMGGLENVINQIRQGTFKFKTERFKPVFIENK